MGIAQRIMFIFFCVVYSHGQRIPQALFERTEATLEQLLRIQELDTMPTRSVEQQLELSSLYATIADYQSAYDTMESMEDSLETDFEFQFTYGGIAGILATELSRTRSLPYVRTMKTCFERAAELNPTNLEVQVVLLKLYAELPWVLGGSNKKAEQKKEEIKGISTIEGYLAEGYLNRVDNKNKEALIAYLDAVNTVRSCETESFLVTNDAYYRLAVLSFFLQKEVPKATCFFVRYLENYQPGDAYPKQFARYYLKKLKHPEQLDAAMEDKLQEYDDLTAWIQNNFK
jgi:hypothetical protein